MWEQNGCRLNVINWQNCNFCHFHTLIGFIFQPRRLLLGTDITYINDDSHGHWLSYLTLTQEVPSDQRTGQITVNEFMDCILKWYWNYPCLKHPVNDSLLCPQRKTSPPSPGQNALTGAMATVSLATETVAQGLERGHVTSRPRRWNVEYLATGKKTLEVTWTFASVPKVRDKALTLTEWLRRGGRNNITSTCNTWCNPVQQLPINTSVLL